MLKEEIKYTDYNGDERTDVAYFNMTKLEAAKLKWAEISKLIQRVLLHPTT